MIDSVFHTSLFGRTLLFMCRVVQNGALEELWERNGATCTISYLRDLSELFQMFKTFVEYRNGEAMDMLGTEDAFYLHVPSEKFQMVPASLDSDRFQALPSTLVTKLH